jgi:hypothetical protein
VQRDESALLECFDRVGDLLYCMALARTGRPAVAEELTEAVFVALWRDPAAFPPSQGPLGLQLLRRMAAGLVSVPLNATTSPKLSQRPSSVDSPPTFTDAASVAALPMARCS